MAKDTITELAKRLEPLLLKTTEGVVDNGAYLKLDASNDPITGQLASSVATGTAPFDVASETVNENLNADMLDGFHAGELMAYTPMTTIGDMLYLPSTNNQALASAGATFTASSSDTNWGQSIGAAFDPANAAGWASLTQGAGSWISADLGAVKDIYEIRMYQMAGASKTASVYRIQYKVNSGDAWTTYEDHNTAGANDIFEISPVITGRYFIFTGITNGAAEWCINKLELRGVYYATRLPIGTTGQVLTVAAGLPGWAVAAIPTTRTISTTAPLTGGGDLSANRTLAIPAATAAADGYATATQIAKLDGIASGANVVNPMSAAGDMIIGGVSGAPARLAKQTNGDALHLVAGVPTWEANAPTFADQAAHKIFSGPDSGADAAPGFRYMAAADIPALPYEASGAVIMAVARGWFL